MIVCTCLWSEGQNPYCVIHGYKTMKENIKMNIPDLLESTATWIEGHPSLPDEPPEALLIKIWHVTKLRSAAADLRMPELTDEQVSELIRRGEETDNEMAAPAVGTPTHAGIRKLLREWDDEVNEHGIWTSGHSIGAKLAAALRNIVNAPQPFEREMDFRDDD